jgi:hypothetical protein
MKTLTIVTMLSLLSAGCSLNQGSAHHSSTLHRIKEGYNYQLPEPKLAPKSDSVHLFPPTATLIPGESLLTPGESSLAEGDIPSVTYWVEPNCQGQVIGKNVLPISQPKNLKQLRSMYPMPEMRLVMYQSYKKCVESGGLAKGVYPTVTTRLSGRAERLLKKIWEMNCAFYYAEHFAQDDRNAKIERYVTWSNTNHNAFVDLSYLFVSTPEGPRNFTETEAKALVAYLRETAQTLVSKLYEKKKEDFSPA